jgi:hypothetical protein
MDSVLRVWCAKARANEVSMRKVMLAAARASFRRHRTVPYGALLYSRGFQYFTGERQCQ